MVAGLLAGMWEFPGLLQEEKKSDVKDKEILCAEINRILGTHLTHSVMQDVGEVSLKSPTDTHTYSRLHIELILSLMVRWQVVHIFSHIHQTYVVHSLRLMDADTHARSENVQWLTRSALQEAAVSTAVKKVFISVTRCVFVHLRSSAVNQMSSLTENIFFLGYLELRLVSVT